MADHKKLFVLVTMYLYATTNALALDCKPLEPKGGADVTGETKGKVDGQIDGLFKKLLTAGLDIDASYVHIQKDVLKTYPQSSQLYIWERLIYMNCGVLAESELSDTAKLTQLNSLTEKLQFGPPKPGSSTNPEAKSQYEKVLSDLRQSLYINGEFVFPAMENFLADQSEINWKRVVAAANQSLNQVQDGIRDSLEYDANQENKKLAAYITSTKHNADKPFIRTFKEARRQWNGKEFVLQEISVTKNVPSEKQAKEWLSILKSSFLKVEVELERLIYLAST